MGSLIKINQGIFYVIKKNIKIVNSELRFVYCLAGKEAFIHREILNAKLSGLQLTGSVEGVVADKLKIQLDIDKEFGNKAEYYFDWKPISSNIMYAMPEKGQRVHLKIGDIRGQQMSVINCIRQNGSTCIDTENADCKIMQYANKKMKLTTDKVIFSSDNEQELFALLELVDIDGIMAQIKEQITVSMKKQLLLHSNTGKLTINTPFQIVLRDSLSNSNAEIAINQTIECQGDVVRVEAETRLEYPPFNDAPVEIKRDWKKLLCKVATAIAVVAAVAAVAAGVAAIVAITGGAAAPVIAAAAAKAAAGVAIGALIGGGVTTVISLFVQNSSDNKNGIKREFNDYIYMGIDQFCTGAIVSAPMATTWVLPAQLITIGIVSFVNQNMDSFLDEKYGGDFYDEDSNMFLNIAFDIIFAGMGSYITKGLNKIVGRVINAPKSDYKAIAKFLNKFFGTNYPTDQAHINELKGIFREPLSKVQKVLRSNWIICLVLGGKEGGLPGADIPTSLITDSNANPILEWLTGEIEDVVETEVYDDQYLQYKRLSYNSDNFTIIDFDESGNLVFE